MALMFGQKTTAVLKLSYLHTSRLKKHYRNHEKLLNFRNLALLKVSTFHLKDKKAIYSDFNDIAPSMCMNMKSDIEDIVLYMPAHGFGFYL